MDEDKDEDKDEDEGEDEDEDEGEDEYIDVEAEDIGNEDEDEENKNEEINDEQLKDEDEEQIEKLISIASSVEATDRTLEDKILSNIIVEYDIETLKRVVSVFGKIVDTIKFGIASLESGDRGDSGTSENLDVLASVAAAQK
jgi:hypothetical protein